MIEPRRLRDAGPEDVRSLLRAASPSRAMTADERARSRARVARHVAVAALAGGLSWLPGAAVGAGLGLIVGLATLAVPGGSSSDPPLSARPAAASAEPSPGAPLDSPVPVVTLSPTVESSPAPARVAPGALSAAAPAPESAADVLAEEVALLDRARAALGASPAQALQLTVDHAARYPRGKLGIERELVAIDALRRLGRGAEAHARAESLLVRARGSLYEDRIRKMRGDPR